MPSPLTTPQLERERDRLKAALAEATSERAVALAAGDTRRMGTLASRVENLTEALVPINGELAIRLGERERLAAAEQAREAAAERERTTREKDAAMETFKPAAAAMEEHLRDLWRASAASVEGFLSAKHQADAAELEHAEATTAHGRVFTRATEQHLRQHHDGLILVLDQLAAHFNQARFQR